MRAAILHRTRLKSCVLPHTSRVSVCQQAAGLAGPADGAAPQVPLSRRPAIYEHSMGEVAKWKADQTARIKQIGDAFEQQDGGPSCSDLLRELDWVLDDAVHAYRASSSAAWEVLSWKQMEPEVRAAAYRGHDTSGWSVQMRAPMRQLYAWWDQRLKERAPFQYLISSAHWYTYVLSVSPGVLIPRPETEIFPELVDKAVKSNAQLAQRPWADLGTGSGAIAISTADVLRKRNKDCVVYAVDLSKVALEHAAFNASACGMASHVRPLQGSWFEPLRGQGLEGKLGGLLSNPPYIPRVQMQTLQAEVGRHEPWSALDGGDGPGTDDLQVLCEGAAKYLDSGGFLAFETAGPPQVHQVAGVLRTIVEPGSSSRAFQEVDVVADCYGVERFVVAHRV